MREPRTESAKRLLFLASAAALAFVLSIAAQCVLFQYAFGGQSGSIFFWLTITPPTTFVSYAGWALWMASGVGVFAAARAMQCRQLRRAVRWSVLAMGFGLAGALTLVSIAVFITPRLHVDELVEAVLPTLAAVVALISSKMQIRRGAFCAECGYDLQGNESGICPECGTAITRVSQS